MPKHERKYNRILLKLSGEALTGDADFGIDPKVLDRMAVEVGQLVGLGVQIGMVIGGGNLFRGAALHSAGMERVTGDHMGMLATVMNALAMRDALERASIPTRVMSAIPMSGVVEHYDRRTAIRHLNASDVVIFSAGTGNPFFTTDTAAVLRGVEIHADVILKGTRVDGIYTADPEKDSNATKFDSISFDDVIKKGLNVMDSTAFTLSQENKLPIVVFDMNKEGNLLKICEGKNIGTIVNV